MDAIRWQPHPVTYARKVAMQLLCSGAFLYPKTSRSRVGFLIVIDWETGQLKHQCEYLTPDSRRAKDQKNQITGFTFAMNRLFACAHNEIIAFDEWPPKTPCGSISDPGFNDLHHCMPFNGHLAVANTGLETVDLMTANGERVERWDLLAEVEGAREIDEKRDYRLIADTKPHRVHANHLFHLGGELWSSQLLTGSAVPVSGGGRPIEMRAGQPHDGEWIGDRLVFTTTNGHLVFVDPDETERPEIINLADLTPRYSELGWCRGVCEDPDNPDRIFVSFSATRRSKWKEYGHAIKNRQNVLRSRITHYDLRERKLLSTFELEDQKQGHLFFQIQPLPKALWL